MRLPPRVLFVSMSLCGAGLASAQSDAPVTAHVEEVEVTGSRLGAEVRPVTVIDGPALRRLPARDTLTALAYAAGIDLRERAPFGAQADVSLYGSGFEGVLLLVDGFPVGDPQTGHHLAELLPPLAAIDHVEILEGPAAAAYGPGAFGGVIQVVTRRPGRDPHAELNASGGQHGLAQAQVHAEASGASLTASRTTTSGYAPDTDLHESRATARIVRGGLDALVLWEDKTFGAWQAYSDVYPNEWEAVRGVAGRVRWSGGGWDLSAGVRHKRDDFLLDRDRPTFYRALHTTDTGTGQASYRHAALGGLGVAGAEWTLERIDSTALGRHARVRAGVFAEWRWARGPSDVDLGVRAERMGGRTWLLPQLAYGRELGRGWRAFASLGRSIRLASFTELYTASPAWLGNPALAPERAWSADAGVRGGLGPVHASAKLFRREASDLIDMVRPRGTTGRLVAANVQEQRLTGVELTAEGPLGRAWTWRAAAMLLGQSAAWPAGVESRYADDTPRHRETAALAWQRGAWTVTGALRSGQRRNRPAHAELDGSVAWSASGRVAVTASVRNLLDAPDRNFFGADLAGRWAWIGIDVKSR